jgi:hypothetical protein
MSVSRLGPLEFEGAQHVRDPLQVEVLLGVLPGGSSPWGFSFLCT